MSDKGDSNPVEDSAEIPDGDLAGVTPDLKAEVQKKEEEINLLRTVVGEKDAKILR